MFVCTQCSHVTQQPNWLMSMQVAREHEGGWIFYFFCAAFTSDSENMTVEPSMNFQSFMAP